MWRLIVPNGLLAAIWIVTIGVVLLQLIVHWRQRRLARIAASRDR